MNLNHAIQLLTEARKRQSDLAREIKQLRTFICQKGGEPDVRQDQILLADRNERIYDEWINFDRTFVELALKYNLSPTRISGICRRLEYQKNKRSTE